MALNIKSDEADRLARELAAVTGESLTTAVTVALQERLKRVRPRSRLAREIQLREIFEQAAQIPARDDRSADEIIGYNEYGAFD